MNSQSQQTTIRTFECGQLKRWSLCQVCQFNSFTLQCVCVGVCTCVCVCAVCEWWSEANQRQGENIISWWQHWATGLMISSLPIIIIITSTEEIICFCLEMLVSWSLCIPWNRKQRIRSCGWCGIVDCDPRICSQFIEHCNSVKRAVELTAVGNPSVMRHYCHGEIHCGKCQHVIIIEIKMHSDHWEGYVLLECFQSDTSAIHWVFMLWTQHLMSISALYV